VRAFPIVPTLRVTAIKLRLFGSLSLWERVGVREIKPRIFRG
jgi:hypothetical protein